MTLKQLLYKHKHSGYRYGLGLIFNSFTNIFMTLATANAFRLVKSDTNPWAILCLSLLLGSLAILSQLLYRLLTISFRNQLLEETRHLAYTKVMSQSTEAFSKKDKESDQARLITHMNQFEHDFFLSLSSISYSILNSLISLIILLLVAWEVALIALASSIGLFFITKAFEKRLQQKQMEVLLEQENYTKNIANLIQGISTIKAYTKETQFYAYFKKIINQLHHKKSEQFALNDVQKNLSDHFAYFAQLSMLIFITIKMGRGELALFQLALATNLSGSIMWSLLNAFNRLNLLKTSITIFNDMTQFKPKIENQKTLVTPLHFQVKDLSYQYDENHKVLDQLSFNIEPKDKVLIVGPSGTGKTTLLNLLSQNLSGYQGTLHINHQELDSINQEDFLQYSSYVRQSHFMFNTSIRNNIILNNKYDEEKYQTILKQCALDTWLLDKDDFILEENGANISGGQKQRISLARALYQDHDLIFLDEPSASLDDENAQTIYETILKLDKTIICVTHRHIDILKNHYNKVIDFNTMEKNI